MTGSVPDAPLVFRNPILNKSFDVLPQVKDTDTPSADPESSVSVRQAPAAGHCSVN